ncbi:unnamed protein product [Bemisia tabaci]|uniref:Uncharacterized protein n=1 Tax=Bemisia tabaci TaxID=7038 RepID=A0A9P0G4Z4_BEMTA|nr:unnamed protein product [Bemisia tabaci]
MLVLKLRFILSPTVLVAVALLTTASCENSVEVVDNQIPPPPAEASQSGPGSGEVAEKSGPAAAALAEKYAPGPYWSMATITNALTPVSDLFAPPTCSPHPLERVFENPDLAPLFKELPNLKDELMALAPGDQQNAEFLFKVYVSLSNAVTPFFHRAVELITVSAPKVTDLAKFNIAAELSTYVQSVVDPIPNGFSLVAKYKLRPPKNPGIRVPSLRELRNVVGRVVLKNVGAPPILTVIRLHIQLSILVKTYIRRQAHNLYMDHGNHPIMLITDASQTKDAASQTKDAGQVKETSQTEGANQTEYNTQKEDTNQKKEIATDSQPQPPKDEPAESHFQPLRTASEHFKKITGIIIKLPI